MDIGAVIDYLEPVAVSTPLEGYGLALAESVTVLRRAENLHDLTKVIEKRRLEWNSDRSLPLDVVLAEAVIEYLGGAGHANHR